MLFTFWMGKVTWLERLCFASATAAGHKLVVYSYEPLANLPSSVVRADANDVIQRDRVFRHRRSGSMATFSDLFRYEGLRRGLGTWIDADVLVLRHFPTSDIIMAQEMDLVGNSVLRLPSDHPFLAEMKRLSEARVLIAPHWPLKHKIHQIARACIGRPMGLAEVKRATFGPPALTRYVDRNNLHHLVFPQDVFFPLPWAQATDAFDPEVDITHFFTSRTVAVHLWHSKVEHLKNAPPPPGSFLARMCEKYQVDFDADYETS